MKNDDEVQRTARQERVDRPAANQMDWLRHEVLAMVSHELRTPITAVLGWSQILRDGDVNGENMAEGLRVIEQNARAQARILDDLLDIGRIASGKLRLVRRPVQLAPVLKAAVNCLLPVAREKQVRLRILRIQPVPPVLADRDRLGQIFRNLLANAIEFTPPGGNVGVRLRRIDGVVQVSVIDDGQGMEPETLRQLFDRFWQADPSVVRRRGGLGLGLAIVKQLVERHGGHVVARSEGLGKGSEFVVTLPLA